MPATMELATRAARSLQNTLRGKASPVARPWTALSIIKFPPNTFFLRPEPSEASSLEFCTQGFGHGVQELLRGQPWLIGPDEGSEVPGHMPGLDGFDADALERGGEVSHLRSVVEAGTIGQATGPSEDRGYRIGRGLPALLMFAVVAGDPAVGGVGLGGPALPGHQKRRPQGQRGE